MTNTAETKVRINHNYSYFYHFNTYTKEWGAMTADSVGHYANRDFKNGNFAFGKTIAEANNNLTIKLEASTTV